MRVRVERDAVWLRACSVIGAVSAASITAWALAWVAALTVAPITIVLVAAALGAWAATHTLCAPTGTLSLRGGTWHWRDDAHGSADPASASAAVDDGMQTPGRIEVAIDLGDWVVVRFVPAAARRAVWLPLSRRVSDGTWAALRAALYSRPLAVRPSAHGGHGPSG